MCRFLAYKGSPILLDKLLYQPKNSLIHQSFEARERREPLNGDGFGLGWYVHDIAPTPAVYLSIRPAWNDINLRSLATHTQADCAFAHVRAASTGDVTEYNCHPFNFNEMLFMHNGDVGGFDRLVRPLRERLSNAVYSRIRGQTDSEHFFALFLDIYLGNGSLPAPRDIPGALLEAIAELRGMKAKLGITEPAWLNIALTDGRIIVATRYVSEPHRPAQTLYYSQGSRYECHNGVCLMRHSDMAEHAVLIVSEKLTDRLSDWNAIPHNHMIVVGEDLGVTLTKIDV